MPTRHVLLAVLVMIVWGVNFVVIHVGLESFPPLLFAALRFALVAIPAVFLVGPARVSWKVIVGVGTFTSAGQFALLFIAIDQGLPAGLASLVLQVQALFTVLLAMLFLGERMRVAQIAGGALALGGIGVIALGRSGAVPLFALGLCVLAGLSWASGNIITRKAEPPEPLALVVWSSLVPPIPLALLSLGFEGSRAWSEAFASIDVPGVLALAYIVVFSTYVGYGAWAWLLGRHPASTVAPFTLLVPVIGIAAAWLTLGEAANAAELAGAAVVLVGLALITGLVGRRRVAPTAPVVKRV